MHSMHHQVQAHNGTITHQMQAQQDLVSQQQEPQKQQLNMTVLEPLEPQSQQVTNQQTVVLSVLDPIQQQQALLAHQQQPMIHHLIPTASGPEPMPHLHQLQPSRQLVAEQESQQAQAQEQQQDQQQQPQQVSESSGQQARARPAQLEGIVSDGGGPIVQWLLENYEIADGESLPRSTVYNHYLAHCRQLRMSSVNAASFGKLIRSVFIGLKTRRLGTRGHSKYHYFGVRAKQHVRLDWLQDDEALAGDGSGGRHAACSSAAIMRDSNENSNGSDGNCGGSESDSTGNCSGRLSSSMGSHQQQHHHQTANSGSNHGGKRLKRTGANNNGLSQDDYSDSLQHQQQQHHGPLDYDGNNFSEQLSMNQQQGFNSHSGHHHQAPNTNGPAVYAYPVNGYEKETAGSLSGAYDDERAVAAHWSVAAAAAASALDHHYDLSSFRNLLGPNKSTLVYENWPARDPDLLARLMDKRELGQVGRPASSQAQANATTSTPQSLAQPDSDSSHLVEHFENSYKFYYRRMVDLLGELQFNEIEHLWSEFWHPPATAVDKTTESSQTANSQPIHWATPTTETDFHQQQQTTLSYQEEPSQQQVVVSNLTFEQLYQLTSKPAMIERINQIDHKLYSAIESFLVVDMLSPLPRPLMQHLRAFARNICIWTEAAVEDYHPHFINEKLKSANAFEQALRRYTSISHLSTASRAIWNNRSTLVQMSIDLSRIDLRDIELQVCSLMNQEKFSNSSQEQAQHADMNQNGRRETVVIGDNLLQQQQQLTPTTTATQNGNSTQTTLMKQQLDCRAPEQTAAASNQSSNDNIENNYNINQHHHNNGGSQSQTNFHMTNLSEFCPLQPAQLVQNFLHLIEDPYPVNAWPDWCRSLVESRVCGQSSEEARNFILKWNFYISLVLRELTLKSAPSLGSFQLIRLLFDEYMYYLVVSRLAHFQHKTSAQLLRPSSKFGNA